MGTSSSSLNELQDNEYLQLFSGKEPITPNDPFWNQLLSFTFVPPHTCADCRLLEDSTRPMLDALLKNNIQTGNLASLVHVFLLHSAELKASVLCENRVFVWQTYNALFILRCVLKYFIETLSEDGTLKQLQATAPSKAGHPKSLIESDKILETLINSLFEIIVDVELENITYAITVEAVNTLLVLLSVQMFSTRSAQLSVVYKTVMQGKCCIHSFLLVKTLVQHFINQEKCPHCINNAMQGGGIISGLASGLWNVLTLGFGRNASHSGESYKTVLANQSLLLLLALVNHCTNEKEVTNPYREALFSFHNVQEPAPDAAIDTIPAFKLDYSKLYSTLCETLKDDQTTLLLYLLLHRNPNFRLFVTSCGHIELLVLPILKILYDAPEKSSHLIYMALIVLLILSEDEQFDKHVHDVKLKNITWYAERTLSEISLGGLIVVVLIRIIQYNMTRMHDKYLHTNCLAALANMSAYLHDLHPYVCQKFVSLLENMAKRQMRITNQLRTSSGQNSDDDMSPSDLMQDLSVLDEVVRMLLEILNSCLTTQLRNNVNLLYTILYKRQVFDSFRSHPTFQDIMQNIDSVLTFFSQHLESVDQNLSVVEVSQIISAVCSQWPKDKLKKFPELKFKYVEEGQPEDFFIPYLWSLVFHASDIYWNSKNILIFKPRCP